MPPDGLRETVDVFQELPGEPALADARRTDDRYQPSALLRGRRVEEVLEESQLDVAADEWRLECLGAIAPTHLGDDSQRTPRRDRGRLSLERLFAGFFECDGARRGPLGCGSDED